ncbi:MAG: DUF935 family protein [Spirochaetales bacterium]|nr:DUF935 family protein [Spirochaetales bacterium]
MGRKKRKRKKKKSPVSVTGQNKQMRLSAGKQFVSGMTAGVTGNTGYYGEAVTGEYLNRLKGGPGRLVYDEMRRSDPQIQAVLKAITLPIRRTPYYVEPPSDKPQDKQIAETIETNLFKDMTITWDDTIRHALLMLPFGFSILEKVWELKPDYHIGLRKLDPRLPQSITRWNIDEKTKSLKHVVQADSNGDEYKLPIEKILVFSSDKEGDNWEGTSILRGAYKPWYLKNDFEKINAIKHDRYGVGIPVANVPEGVQKGSEAWEDTEEALESLHANEQGYIVAPEGYKFELLTGGETGAGTNTLESIKYYDEMIAKCMLAMFISLGTSQTGSRALGSSFIDVFLDSLQAYADYMCEVVSRFCLKEYVDYNWQVKEYPVLKAQRIKRLDTQTIALLVKSGVIKADRDLENSVREVLNLPEQKEEVNVNVRKKEKPGTEETDEKETGEEKDETGEEVEAEEQLSTRKPFQFKTGKNKGLSKEEEIVDLISIENRLDKAEYDLTKELLAMKEQQREDIINQLVAGRKVQNIRVILKKDMFNLLMKAFKNQLNEGRKEVREELKNQGLTKIKMASENRTPEDYSEYVDIIAEETMIDIEDASHKLVSILSFKAVEGAFRRGLRGEALKSYLEQYNLSDRTWKDMLAGAINKGWGAGRDLEGKRWKDDIEYACYSCVLDKDSCRVCAALDGKEHAVGDPDYITPNPDCLGCNRCRCMTIFVLKHEGMSEEEFPGFSSDQVKNHKEVQYALSE